MAVHVRPSFKLCSVSKSLDRRINPVRGDLADVTLAGKIFVPHYAAQITKCVISSRAGIYAKADLAATMVSELLLNEQFSVLDITGNWAWGYCVHDHYVGYIECAALGNLETKQRRTTVADFVKTAETYVSAPYLWGGRSHDGIDCSGLVQVSLASIACAAPRDADQQMAALGVALDESDRLQRGDLIFFPGHVGIMVDDANMVHATGFHHKTIIEPLAAVVARVAEKYAQPILARKRIV